MNHISCQPKLTGQDQNPQQETLSQYRNTLSRQQELDVPVVASNPFSSLNIKHKVWRQLQLSFHQTTESARYVIEKQLAYNALNKKRDINFNDFDSNANVNTQELSKSIVLDKTRTFDTPFLRELQDSCFTDICPSRVKQEMSKRQTIDSMHLEQESMEPKLQRKMENKVAQFPNQKKTTVSQQGRKSLFNLINNAKTHGLGT